MHTRRRHDQERKATPSDPKVARSVALWLALPRQSFFPASRKLRERYNIMDKKPKGTRNAAVYQDETVFGQMASARRHVVQG